MVRFKLRSLAVAVALGTLAAQSYAFRGTRSANHITFELMFPAIEMTIVPTPTDGGIREDIPGKYKDRFEKWKSELLSTDIGRREWNAYAGNKEFILTVTVSGDTGKGAGTGKYRWDDSGKLVGATITLGSEIDRGFPSPVYYPVMQSLRLDGTTYTISGSVLAATKLAHEIGHVDQTSRASEALMQLQEKLIPVYTSIFLKNGWKTSDERLVDLANKMGGTPVEIWESREYESELAAMAYVKERLGNEDYYCDVLQRIRRNVDDYAGPYRQLFEQSPALAQAPCR